MESSYSNFIFVYFYLNFIQYLIINKLHIKKFKKYKMETKSFSCKIRNNISEISFIESLLYV